MKVLSVLMILVVSVGVYGEAPTYVMLKHSVAQMSGQKNANCRGLCSQTSHGDPVQFQVGGGKSREGGMKVREIKLGEQRFAIALQDEFFSQDGIPFFTVEFPPEDGISHRIYALKASSGTAGTSFHYFIKYQDKFVYSGMHPELTFDRERKQFVSLEKDGATLHQTTWKLVEGSFQAIQSEVMP